jgi:hypothetical protein
MLDEPYRSQAIANTPQSEIDKPQPIVKSKAGAVISGFNWDDSPENKTDYYYWYNFYLRCSLEE